MIKYKKVMVFPAFSKKDVPELEAEIGYCAHRQEVSAKYHPSYPFQKLFRAHISNFGPLPETASRVALSELSQKCAVLPRRCGSEKFEFWMNGFRKGGYSGHSRRKPKAWPKVRWGCRRAHPPSGGDRNPEHRKKRWRSRADRRGGKGWGKHRRGEEPEEVGEEEDDAVQEMELGQKKRDGDENPERAREEYHNRKDKEEQGRSEKSEKDDEISHQKKSRINRKYIN